MRKSVKKLVALTIALSVVLGSLISVSAWGKVPELFLKNKNVRIYYLGTDDEAIDDAALMRAVYDESERMITEERSVIDNVLAVFLTEEASRRCDEYNVKFFEGLGVESVQLLYGKYWGCSALYLTFYEHDTENLLKAFHRLSERYDIWFVEPDTMGEPADPDDPTEPEIPEIPILFGDLNGDGNINAQDRIILSRHLARWTGYETIITLIADLNKDGKADAKDRIILTRHLAKWQGYENLG